MQSVDGTSTMGMTWSATLERPKDLYDNYINWPVYHHTHFNANKIKLVPVAPGAITPASGEVLITITASP
jgi:hypothetical protein